MLDCLSLLVPFAAIPGYSSAADILDVWGNPLLQGKWKDCIQAVKFFSPPPRMVLTGRCGPIHTQKFMAMITLGNVAQPSAPAIELWKPTIFDSDAIRIMVVDVHEELRWKAFHLLRELGLPGLIQAEGTPQSWHTAR